MARLKSQVLAERRYDAKRAGKRARSWTALVYSESAVEGWRDVLADQLVQAVISPLHDKDINTDGERKKPHWHVVISFVNPVTRERASEVFDAIGAVMPPVTGGRDAAKVSDFRQMCRYLCHLDQPSKHRYPVEEVRTVGGIDYRAVIMSAADEDDVLDEMEEFIESHQVISFVTFARYVRQHRPEWRWFLRHKHAYYIRELIKSNQWTLLHAEMVEQVELMEVGQVDREGGGGFAADYDPPSQSSQFPDVSAGQNDFCNSSIEVTAEGGQCGWQEAGSQAVFDGSGGGTSG